jgi:hypothetical protein
MDYCGIYFDIKAFGFHGYLAHRLKERLEHELPGRTIFVEESWDLSVDVFQKLISGAPGIAASLRDKKILSFDRLRIRVEEPKPVHVSGITADPYLLAQENQTYTHSGRPINLQGILRSFSYLPCIRGSIRAQFITILREQTRRS